MSTNSARRRNAGPPVLVTLLLVAGMVLAACSAAPPSRGTAQSVEGRRTAALAPAAAAHWTSVHNTTAGLHKIKHVVMIMQENRSFDDYFGTYPGADGLQGRMGTCLPKGNGGCLAPWADHADVNGGGPHDRRAFYADVDGGRMDGFLKAAIVARGHCADPNNPACSNNNGLDSMGYHTGSDIPNYWAYAKNFVLQDHMYEPNHDWSLPEHLWGVSEWAAVCKNRQAASCTNFHGQKQMGKAPANGFVGNGVVKLRKKPTYAWTDLTYLLHRAHVSWGYFVKQGTEPDCRSDAAVTCHKAYQSAVTPGIWNPLPNFVDVQQDHQVGNIAPTTTFLRDARTGHLPSVSWVIPSGQVSEHPPGRVSAGQSYVTHLVNTIMKGPDWKSTAIFISWDDWGGFYDHVQPPTVDSNGYGFRVPGLVLSPYARRGYLDHQSLSFDAYVKFVEDVFLHGERLDPATDGRPDRRPDVRENNPALGDLSYDFDFSQQPRPPMLLPEHPRTTLTH